MRYIESHHINHFTKKNPQGQNKKNINKWGMIVNPEYLTAPKKKGGGGKNTLQNHNNKYNKHDLLSI